MSVNSINRMFLGLVLVLFFLGIIGSVFHLFHDETLDIQVGNTYYIIEYAHFFIIFGIYLALISGVYILLKNLKWNSKLSAFHFVMTIIGIAMFMVFYYWVLEDIHRRYYSFDDVEKTKSFFTKNRIFTLSVISFVLGQLAFVLNLFFASIKSILARMKK